MQLKCSNCSYMLLFGGLLFPLDLLSHTMFYKKSCTVFFPTTAIMKFATCWPSQYVYVDSVLVQAVVSRALTALWNDESQYREYLQNLMLFLALKESDSVNRHLYSDWKVERCPNFLILLCE